MIGTRKGAFIASTDSERRRWDLKGPFLKGLEVNDLTSLPSSVAASAGPLRIYAAAKSAWWGAGIQVSDDLGETWSELPGAIRFGEKRGLAVDRIWVLEADCRRQDHTLYAGVDPGALFRTCSSNEGWEELQSLTDHPTRDSWMPGGGGLMVHCVSTDPDRAERMYVGISAAGVFRSDDDGLTWSPKNKGVLADFLPDKSPAVGQCVHHLAMHPGNSQILYQQNHCGVYRSDNAGDDWTDISAGLPSRFGFPLAVHPHDGDIIYVIPEESSSFRATPGGAFGIYRSADRGSAWQVLQNGLPQSNAHVNVLRHGMTTDSLDQAGIYVGTQGGQILLSLDDGDHWELLFNWLPPIYSLQATVIEG